MTLSLVSLEPKPREEGEETEVIVGRAVYRFCETRLTPDERNLDADAIKHEDKVFQHLIKTIERGET